MIEPQAAKHQTSENLNESGLRWWGQVIDYQLIDLQCAERILAFSSRISASLLSGFGKGHLNT
jgi:hypothetical protein